MKVGDYIHWRSADRGRYYWAQVIESRGDGPTLGLFIRYVSSPTPEPPMDGAKGSTGWISDSICSLRVMDDVEAVGLKLVGVL